MSVTNLQEFIRVQIFPAGAVAAGDVVNIGSMLGYYTEAYSAADLALGKPHSVVLSGVAGVVKTAGAAWTVGLKIYFDGTKFTHVSTSNVFAGVATIAAASADVVGTIHLYQDPEDIPA